MYSFFNAQMCVGSEGRTLPVRKLARTESVREDPDDSYAHRSLPSVLRTVAAHQPLSSVPSITLPTHPSIALAAPAELNLSRFCFCTFILSSVDAASCRKYCPEVYHAECAVKPPSANARKRLSLCF